MVKVDKKQKNIIEEVCLDDIDINPLLEEKNSKNI
jgi:hypothetical protein